MRRWQRWNGRGSIISGIIPHARRTGTCGGASRGCMNFCGLITITKAPTGPRTSLIGSRVGRPGNWRKCRPTTSWICTRTWRRRSRTTCPPVLLPGSPRRSFASTATSIRGSVSRAGCNGTAAGPRVSGRRSYRCFRGRRSIFPRCSSPPSSCGTARSGRACTNMVGCHLLEGAGHWVQQEQAEQVTALLLGFLG